MAAYASVEDVAARLGRPVLDDEKPRVDALLDDVSALIAEHCTGTWDRVNPPASFKVVACAEVIRWLAVTPGVISERTGELEIQFSASASTAGLSEAAKSGLRRYRRALSSIPLVREVTPCPGTSSP
ncbi:hypothetical protein ACIPYS_17860 [Kitasatospora sp. NPDC089913]|uniref:hypothetical protein n=1 Tax=Kitasatospora sp. NPDC089913 TaxID=3364080 RepID=UPI0038007E9B